MTAVVFCLACQHVMNISEYVHPAHKCVEVQPGSPKLGNLSPAQQRAMQHAFDDWDDAS